jgi:hypothetical protein
VNSQVTTSKDSSTSSKKSTSSDSDENTESSSSSPDSTIEIDGLNCDCEFTLVVEPEEEYCPINLPSETESETE